MSKPRLPSQSRHTLLWTVAVYCALQGAALGVALSVPALREPIYGRKLTSLRARLDRPEERPLKVVAFGSSRTLNSLRGDLIEPAISERIGRPAVVFNMGVPGAGPVINLLHLRRLIADGIEPDVAVFEVLPPFLVEDGLERELKEDAWPTPNFRLGELAEVRRHAGNSRSVSAADWWLARSNPICRYRFAFLSRVLPMILARRSVENCFDGIDAAGWFAVPIAADAGARPRAIAHMRESYEPWLKNARMSSASLQPIGEALNLCRQRRIPAVLVLYPEGPIFRSLYEPGAREQVRSMLDAVSRTWDVPVIDASGWFPDEAAFYDSHHQTAETATAFTHRLGKELLALPPFAPSQKASGPTGGTR